MTEYTKDQIRENRRLWIGALESGDYQKTVGQLVGRTGTPGVLGYCCLGVAAATLDGAKLSLTSPTGFIAPAEDPLDFPEGDWYGSLLPLPTMLALGLETDNPVAVWQGKTVGLTTLNDDYNWSLTEIAAVIRVQDEVWTGNLSSDAGWSPSDPPPRPVLQGV